MTIKVLEIRDVATLIPAFAISTDADGDEQRGLLCRVGFLAGDAVILGYLSGERPSSADPYFWGGRTMPVAHQYIIEKFADLNDGDVVDVEFILGETRAPKVREARA